MIEDGRRQLSNLIYSQVALHEQFGGVVPEVAARAHLEKLPGLVQAAYDLGAKWVTLEVRTSNENAQRMYENFGFKVIGRRRGYYTDNGEDAIVMWSDSIYSPRFRKAFEENLARIDGEVAGLRREKPLTDNQ